MSALRIIVNELDPEDLPKVNRHGLELFKKDHLWQFETYLEGLYNLNVKTENRQIAIGKFVKSLRFKSTMQHHLSRKALLHMHELLSSDKDKTEKDIEWFNLHNADNKIQVAKRKQLSKLPSNMKDEFIFRKSGEDSPEHKFEKVLTIFKETIAENPRKTKIMKEQELL